MRNILPKKTKQIQIVKEEVVEEEELSIEDEEVVEDEPVEEEVIEEEVEVVEDEVIEPIDELDVGTDGETDAPLVGQEEPEVVETEPEVVEVEVVEVEIEQDFSLEESLMDTQIVFDDTSVFDSTEF